MKKVLVLYKSKTGFSQRYAEWIAKELQCDLIGLPDFKEQSLAEYGLIIYGSGLYAGQINGIGKIKRWMNEFPEKTWVVFATGATPSKENYEELIFKTNFRQGEVRPAHFFYLISGINYEKMSLVDRLLIRFFSNMASRKTGKQQTSKQTSIDLSNRDYIEELLRYVRLKARQ
ncbi:MAG: flavodoxin domain-containing protein [Anaerolineaceae bacterium]